MAARQLESFTVVVKQVGSTMEALPSARSAHGTGYRTVLSVKVLGLVIKFSEKYVREGIQNGVKEMRDGPIIVG